jgi:predicted RNA-binding protein
MSNWWLVVGKPENWQIALLSKGIWGLRDSARHRMIWEELSAGDNLVFYATRPVGGVIGYGVVVTKFRQDTPLWPEEVKQAKVIWPYRFEFDVKSLIPQDRWEKGKLKIDELRALVRGGFQPLRESIGMKVASNLEEGKPTPSVIETQTPSPHDEIKKKLVEIGRIRRFVAESEYQVDGTRLDVVWRRIERGAPTYVFEVQVGGDLYHALGKLKHAYDLWNSNIFLIAKEEDIPKANELLTGTYHEIGDRVKLIELQKIEELFRRKKAYHDFEEALGII